MSGTKRDFWVSLWEEERIDPNIGFWDEFRAIWRIGGWMDPVVVEAQGFFKEVVREELEEERLKISNSGAQAESKWRSLWKRAQSVKPECPEAFKKVVQNPVSDDPSSGIK